MSLKSYLNTDWLNEEHKFFKDRFFFKFFTMKLTVT